MNKNNTTEYLNNYADTFKLTKLTDYTQLDNSTLL